LFGCRSARLLRLFGIDVAQPLLHCLSTAGEQNHCQFIRTSAQACVRVLFLVTSLLISQHLCQNLALRWPSVNLTHHLRRINAVLGLSGLRSQYAVITETVVGKPSKMAEVAHNNRILGTQLDAIVVQWSLADVCNPHLMSRVSQSDAHAAVRSCQCRYSQFRSQCCG
jgi:hypothetical protein